MLAFWSLIVIGIILLVRSLSGSRPDAPNPPGPPPDHVPLTPPPAQALAILQERYARGEIDREEFLQKKADLDR